jgi:hypothetical protein
MVVYTTDDGEFGAVAERIATDRDESVTSELAVALESDEPVVYVDDPSNVVEEPLLELQQRLLDRGPERGAFGVVTGYTPEAAEDLYFPGEESNGEDTLLFSRHPPEDLPDPPNATVFEKAGVTASNLQDLTDEKRRSFEIEAGGRFTSLSTRASSVGSPGRSRSKTTPTRNRTASAATNSTVR